MKDSSYHPEYRNMIVGLNVLVPLRNGKRIPAVNFDNAATTPPFKAVLQEINDFAPWYSSIHRGTGYKSCLSSMVYENSRYDILDFVNGNEQFDTVIYVKNATEAINKVSYRLCGDSEKCVVLSTSMEHHSNDLPWRNKFIVDYIELDHSGRLDISDLKLKLAKYRDRVKLVAVSGASNVTGYENPIYEIAKIVHNYNSKILVDGAQLVPHRAVDMKPYDDPEHIDFLVFSAHKMYAPFGTGVLVGPIKEFEKGDPDYSGGGTVDVVTPDIVTWDDPPAKEEAGTPNLMGIVALVAAVKTINRIGMKNIAEHENYLLGYMIDRIYDIKDIELYGEPFDKNNRVGILPFNIKGIHNSTSAEILSCEFGIAVRNGCFCAQPYIQKLLHVNKSQIDQILKSPDDPRPGMVRISFGLYNTVEEIDYFIKALKYIVRNKNYFANKYSTKDTIDFSSDNFKMKFND